MGLCTWLAAAPAAAVEPNPLEQSHDGPIRIAVIGATRDRAEPWDATELVRAVERYDPHLVVLTGGYVARGTAREWADWRDRWTTLADRLVALPDRDAYRRDRSLERWAQQGVRPGPPNLPGGSWGTGVLESRGTAWRVLALDTERQRLGTGWLDQRTWLPRAVRAPTEPTLVFASRPLASLQHSPELGSHATRELLGAIDESASPGAVRAVFSGGSRTNEFLLHAGPFGEAHVVAGNATLEALDLDRFGHSDFSGVGDMALVADFDAAVRRAWTERTRSAPPPDRYPAEQLQIRGWWQVEIDGADLDMGFQLDDGAGGWEEIYRVHYTQARGWVMDGAR